ncbi:glutathione S-transferase family protein [uncultured Tateyamaria sp.]|uniref:glutathione S-transferase family protein n=1 Tax=uncultured Tateyamaria sp. TaxID=455651 RepID=UPI00260AA373|nr:glutathione S-transferase family protein [uncultured Tateyamaria sp.]
MTYVLHYAPDNASLIVRLALNALDVPFETALVDRAAHSQRDPAYLALNPNGLIPTLITPHGPLFETGAILLWLVDTHGDLGPGTQNSRRADFLKWLFFCSNTVHPALQLLFYPHKLVGDDPEACKMVTTGAKRLLRAHFATLDTAQTSAFAQTEVTVIDLYIATMLRWCAIYGPEDRTWFSLADTPALARICAHVEALPATGRAQMAEGLGATPFTAPARPNPPEGSAL